jgi:hypothetical protein
MVIGPETFTLQNRKAHSQSGRRNIKGAIPPRFFGVGLLPRAILSAQPQRSRSRDQSVTGRRTIRPASSDMTLSSCGGSCGSRCHQRSGRRDRGCSGGGAIAHLPPPPRQEWQLGGWRRPFVTSTSRIAKHRESGPLGGEAGRRARARNPNGPALPDHTVTSVTGESAALRRHRTERRDPERRTRYDPQNYTAGRMADCGLIEPSAADK